MNNVYVLSEKEENGIVTPELTKYIYNQFHLELFKYIRYSEFTVIGSNITYTKSFVVYLYVKEENGRLCVELTTQPRNEFIIFKMKTNKTFNELINLPNGYLFSIIKDELSKKLNKKIFEYNMTRGEFY